MHRCHPGNLKQSYTMAVAVNYKIMMDEESYSGIEIILHWPLSPVHTSDADEPPTVGGTNFDAYEYLTGSYSGV